MDPAGLRASPERMDERDVEDEGDEMAGNQRSLIVLIVLFIGLGLPACVEVVGYDVANFFFDGVPNPNASKQEEKNRTPSERSRAAQAHVKKVLAGTRPRSTHKPYKKAGGCTACHAFGGGFSRQGGGLALRKTVREGLCSTCHTSVAGDVAYVHGPVAVNACTYCHHPHFSSQPHLLREPVADLCTSCHDDPDLMASPAHEGEKGKECLACHDPHGSDRRFFLKHEVEGR